MLYCITIKIDILYNLAGTNCQKLDVCNFTSIAFSSPSLTVSIKLINNHLFCICIMPNLDPWINQNIAINKFENHLLAIRAELKNMIHPKPHPTYNERHEKIIDMIDWTLEKYKTTAAAANTQEMNEQLMIIDNIIEELAKKRDTARHKRKKSLLKDKVWKYGGEEEDIIDYVLIQFLTTGKLI
jgi:hypothetical protein